MSKRKDDNDSTRRKKWFQRLRAPYRLLIRDDETYEEKLSLRLSRLNVFVITGALAILLVVATVYIIAFTPLREYIPGYADVNLSRNVYELHHRTDSLVGILQTNERYMSNIRRILAGEAPDDLLLETEDTLVRQYTDIQITHSEADSLLRLEFENQSQNYTLANHFNPSRQQSITGINFFTPLKGHVTSEYDPSKGHFGIDIVAPENAVVKATLSGIVFFTGWTIETGHVIILQHQNNFISVYKHNAVLLKRDGEFVRAGEPVAIVGESGEYLTGPHLHFELWFNGNPVNPRDYMLF